MKPNYLYFLLIFPLVSFAQSIEIGAGGGTGAFYFVEEADNSVFTAYDSPASMYFDIKYSFEDKIEGIKLRVQSTSVNVVGEDYQTGIALDGLVQNLTWSLLYERLRSDKIFNIGYNAGLGHTVQTFDLQKNTTTPALVDRFMSITGGGIFTLRLHKDFRLRAETGLLWTDPINSFRGSENWQTAGEDLSFLVQVGLSYRLFGKKD